MKLMCIALSTLLTLSLAPIVLFRRRLIRVLLSLGGMFFWVVGVLYVVMVHVVQSLPLIPGIGGFLLICTVSTSGFLIPWC